MPIATPEVYAEMIAYKETSAKKRRPTKTGDNPDKTGVISGTDRGHFEPDRGHFEQATGDISESTFGRLFKEHQ